MLHRRRGRLSSAAARSGRCGYAKKGIGGQLDLARPYGSGKWSTQADFYPFDMNFLGSVATRIANEVKGVNRVAYDVTSKPPGTIEWE